MAKILIIDDDPDFQEATRMVLLAAGFEVSSAYDAEDGVAKVEADKPDLVILDVVMPSDHEGFEVARRIREDLKLRDLPIIILSAVHEVKGVSYRFAPDDEYLPVDVFLDKPTTQQQLCDKVRELLGEGGTPPEDEMPL